MLRHHQTHVAEVTSNLRSYEADAPRNARAVLHRDVRDDQLIEDFSHQGVLQRHRDAGHACASDPDDVEQRVHPRRKAELEREAVGVFDSRGEEVTGQGCTMKCESVTCEAEKCDSGKCSSDCVVACEVVTCEAVSCEVMMREVVTCEAVSCQFMTLKQGHV